MTDQPEQEFDPGFRIVDKRQAEQPQAEAPSEPPPDAPESPPQAEAGAAEEPEVEPLDIYGVVNYCVNLLSGHAWQTMGLVMNPATLRVERDLAQARLAIDCVEALLKRAQEGMTGEQADRARELLNNLRMNYVSQASQEG